VGRCPTSSIFFDFSIIAEEVPKKTFLFREITRQIFAFPLCEIRSGISDFAVNPRAFPREFISARKLWFPGNASFRRACPEKPGWPVGFI
jgi:hypothetical protein